jgi:hypothetical protein
LHVAAIRRERQTGDAHVLEHDQARGSRRAGIDVRTIASTESPVTPLNVGSSESKPPSLPNALPDRLLDVAMRASARMSLGEVSRQLQCRRWITAPSLTRKTISW